MLYPFAYILFIIILYLILTSKDFDSLFKRFLLLECFFSCSRMNIGYLTHVFNSEIEYNDLILGIVFCLSIIQIFRKRKVNKKVFKYSIILISVVLISMLNCYLNPAAIEVVGFNSSLDKYFRGDLSQLTMVHFSIQSIMMFARLIIFITIINATKVSFSKEEILNFCQKLLKYLKILILYGLFEFIIKFIFHIDISTYIYGIFGHGVSSPNIVSRLSGLSREPSYYSLALFIYLFLSFLYNQYYNKNFKVNAWMILALFLGFVSTSFSFVICFVSLTLLYINNYRDFMLTVKKKKQLFNIIFGILLISGIFIIVNQKFLDFALASNYTSINRLGNSIIQIKNGFKGLYILGKDYSSETVRLIGAIIAFKAGLHRPLFGLGLGTVYCVNGVVSIISNIGILGFICWLLLLFKGYTNNINFVGIIIILLTVLFCNDLYTLYDVSYVILLPLYSLYYENRRFN